MPKFKFVAFDAQARETKGFLDAESQTRAIDMIRGKGYFPTSVREVGGTVTASVEAEKQETANDTGLRKEISAERDLIIGVSHELRDYRIELGSVVQLLAAVNPAIPVVIRSAQEPKLVQFKLETLRLQNDDEQMQKIAAAKLVFADEMERQRRAYEDSTRKEFVAKRREAITAAFFALLILAGVVNDHAIDEPAFVMVFALPVCLLILPLAWRLLLHHRMDWISAVPLVQAVAIIASAADQHTWHIMKGRGLVALCVSIVAVSVSVVFAHILHRRRQAESSAIKETPENRKIWKNMETDVAAFFEDKIALQIFCEECRIYTLAPGQFATEIDEMQRVGA